MGLLLIERFYEPVVTKIRTRIPARRVPEPSVLYYDAGLKYTLLNEQAQTSLGGLTAWQFPLAFLQWGSRRNVEHQACKQ